MEKTATGAYDTILYPGGFYRQTHPDRLATLGTLFGMQPAPANACRVLELGCGTGDNLIAPASWYPDSTYVGIDLAVRPILQGQEVAKALALDNVQLSSLDLMDLPEDLGTFDYIIAHGVYSWIPPEVGKKLFEICKTHLAPQGIAYISFVTYPGAYLTRITREMMRFHATQFAEPQRYIDQSRALLAFLVEAQPEAAPFGTLLEQEKKRVDAYEDSYFFHDDLAELYRPCYFHQFMEEATSYDLQYLGDANFHEMQTLHLPEHVRETLSELGEDMIRKEQLLDFIKGRRFRCTLLCHEDVSLQRTIDLSLVKDMLVAAPARSLSLDPDSEMEKFSGLKGAFAETDDALRKAALHYLGEQWPRYVPLEEWSAGTQTLLTEQGLPCDAPPAIAHDLAETTLHLYGVKFLDLRMQLAPYVVALSERPRASRLARYQAQTSGIVITQTGRAIDIQDTMGRRLLTLLDGTRDRDALVAALVETARATLDPNAPPRPNLIEEITALLESALENLARNALLVA